MSIATIENALAPFLVAPPIFQDTVKHTEEERRTHKSPSADAPSVSLQPFVVDEVVLAQSPFPKRRATIVMEGCDRVCDADWLRLEQQQQHAADSNNTSEQIRIEKRQEHLWEEEYYVCPTSLPASKTKQEEEKRKKVVTKAVSRTKGKNPFQNLSFIFDEAATNFTAVLCTLQHNGLTFLSHRKNMVESSNTQFKSKWSFKYLKRPLPSDFVNINIYRFQKINHLPQSGRISRKDELHQTLMHALLPSASASASASTCGALLNNRFVQVLNRGERFFPLGWLVPEASAACEAALRRAENKKKLFIMKRVGGTGGLDICLLRAGAQFCLADALAAVPSVTGTGPPPPTPNAPGAAAAGAGPKTYIVQEYIDHPFLIHNHKFDLRVYVVVTSCYPLRMYIYKEGLVRIATARYCQRCHRNSDMREEEKEDDEDTDTHASGGLAPIEQLTAHLTNFTLNKESENYSSSAGATTSVADDFAFPSYKWSFAALEAYIEEQNALHRRNRSGGALIDYAATMERVRQMLVQVFLTMGPYAREALEDIHAKQLEKPNADRPSPPAAAAAAAAAGAPTEGEAREKEKEVVLTHLGVAAPAVRVLAPTELPCTYRGVSPYFQIFGVDVLLRYKDKETFEMMQQQQEEEDAGKDHEGGEKEEEVAKSVELFPVLLEINSMPSLSTHYTLLDQCIKGNMVADALTLAGLTSPLIKPSPAGPKKAAAAAGEGEAGEKKTTASSPLPLNAAQRAFLQQFAPPPAQGEDAEADAQERLLDSLVAEACMTLEEEKQRCGNFECVFPCKESVALFAPPRAQEDHKAEGSQSCVAYEKEALLTPLDYIMCEWENLQ